MNIKVLASLSSKHFIYQMYFMIMFITEIYKINEDSKKKTLKNKEF